MLLLRMLRKVLNCYLSYSYRKRYNIDSTFKFNGNRIFLYGDGEIILGKNSYIGDNSRISAQKGYSVKVGRNCRISHNVSIYTSTNIADQDLDKNPHNQENHQTKRGNIHIEDGVWIGVNCYISPGVTIGHNRVIGANSVVTGPVEPNAIYGGVPAQLIRYKKGNL